jgi:hypothetical protein
VTCHDVATHCRTQLPLDQRSVAADSSDATTFNFKNLRCRPTAPALTESARLHRPTTNQPTTSSATHVPSPASPFPTPTPPPQPHFRLVPLETRPSLTSLRTKCDIPHPPNANTVSGPSLTPPRVRHLASFHTFLPFSPLSKWTHGLTTTGIGKYAVRFAGELGSLITLAVILVFVLFRERGIMRIAGSGGW